MSSLIENPGMNYQYVSDLLAIISWQSSVNDINPFNFEVLK